MLPWTIPGANLTIPVGVDVYIPIGSFQKDPEYWENPLEFNPERFNAENTSKIRTGTYAPFGLGPRKCLGSNYAILKIKFILIRFLCGKRHISGEFPRVHGAAMPRGG